MDDKAHVLKNKAHVKYECGWKDVASEYVLELYLGSIIELTLDSQLFSE